jgi:hypothetical protein
MTDIQDIAMFLFFFIVYGAFMIYILIELDKLKEKIKKKAQ